MSRMWGLLAYLGAMIVLAGCAIPIAGSASPADLPAPSAPGLPTPSFPPIPTAPGGVFIAEPLVPGWNTVRSVNRAALYDVPPTWTVDSEDTIRGYELEDGTTVVGSGSAAFGEEVCGENTSLAISVIKHSTGTDLAAASRAYVQEWGDIAFRDEAETAPALQLAPPETITTLSGRPGVVVRADATAASPATDCGITTGAVWAISVPGFSGELGPTVVLIVVAVTAVPGVVPEAEIRQVLSTLRPER